MKFKGLIVGIVLTSLMITGIVFAGNSLDGLSKENTNMVSEEDVINKLKTKSFGELINEINILGDNIDMSNLILHATILKEKAINISSDQLQTEILNENNSNNTRIILMQISRHLDKDIDNEALKSILQKDNIDFEIKRNALLNIYKNNENDSATLEKVALGNDDRLSFQAIKMLNKNNPDKAIEIADNIIKSNNGVVTYKMRAAIKVKANQLANNSTKIERAEFIDFCDVILTKNNNKTNDIITDTLIFALSDVMSEETISYIVNSDKTDNTVKVFCIDQNYNVLKSMLTKNYSKENLDVVIKAMKICPLKEMEEPLQNIMSEQLLKHSSQTGGTIEELQKVVDLIDENGVSATDKY